MVKKKVRKVIHMYMRDNGNGEIIINKRVIALITVLVILATTFASVVAFSVGVKSDVSYNAEKISNNEQLIDDVDKETKTNTISVGKIETDINNIKEDISEIKLDVKELLKRNGGGK